MLDNVQFHPSLLADLTLDAKALAAQETLMNMLDTLPEYSFVFQYIYDNIDHPVEVMARWHEFGLGSLQYSVKSINAYNLIARLRARKTTFDGGVYALNAPDRVSYVPQEDSQYVGSTYNHFNRLKSHMSNFKQFKGPVLDLTDKYQWASVNGGLAEWKWFEVYRTFNFYMNFVQAYPLYSLSCGEFIILASLSKFLPRLLEQSLLNVWCFNWNKAHIVNFDLPRWDPRSLGLNVWGNKANHVQIQDFYTGEVLRECIPSLTMAKDALGIRHTSWKPWYSKLPIHIQSKVLNRKVTIRKATAKSTPFLFNMGTFLDVLMRHI